MMAVIGWLAVLAFTVAVSLCTAGALMFDSRANGKVSIECIALLIFSAVMWWATYINAPFAVSMKP